MAARLCGEVRDGVKKRLVGVENEADGNLSRTRLMGVRKRLMGT